METIKIVFILIPLLAFFWGIIGATNEFSDSRRKSIMTYIGGSIISSTVMMLLMLVYLKLI